MKHYFILNPAAGKGKKQNDLADAIKKACTERSVDYEIYFTVGCKDAERFVRETAKKEGEKQLRFYMCGGDGTFNEGVNGAVGFDNVSVGIIPVGTGNDFVRNFENKESFFDISAQLDGQNMEIDLISYGDRYCANMMNIGFDCKAAIYASEMKKKAFVPAKLAYIAGVLKALIKMPGVKAKVHCEGEDVAEKDCILVCVANGMFCGGGFKCAPYVAVNDGKMNLNAISRVNRVQFVQLVGSYKNGTYVTDKNADIIDYNVCTSATLEFDSEAEVSIDGEVERHSSLKLEIKPRAVKFIVPQGCVPVKTDALPSVAHDRTGSAVSV